MAGDKRIEVTEDGPYVVTGAVPIAKQIIEVDEDGESVAWVEGEELHRHAHYALCRCGASESKPFCDASHMVVGFDGTETATRESYEDQADVIEGPAVRLMDAVQLCADTGFCHTKRIWSLARSAETAEDVDDVMHGAALCPSGRYTAIDKATGESSEPTIEPSIGLIEDPSKGVSGPIWVRGGIPIQSAEGIEYEVRNRAALCRCGASENKPFCDGSHVEIGFKAE